MYTSRKQMIQCKLPSRECFLLYDIGITQVIDTKIKVRRTNGHTSTYLIVINHINHCIFTGLVREIYVHLHNIHVVVNVQ